jgi:hypothetical protein
MADDRKNSAASLAAYSALAERFSSLGDETPINQMKVDPKVSKKIADAYDSLKHNPDDPKVQKAYKALIDETSKQYEDMLSSGMKVQKITPEMSNPYSTSKDLVEDVTKNKNLFYYPTEQGFGSMGADQSKHPMLQSTKYLDPEGKPMLANDLFRVVHDYQGHAKQGHKFGATGEERAFQEHSKMFSPEARKALVTETRGQNSWVNYGPMGEANRANPKATVYADQKAGLLPDWTGKSVEELSSPLKYNARKAGLMALKAGLPAAAIGAASSAESADQALMDILIPGGAEAIGESPEEEAMLMGEAKGWKDYQDSPAANARRAALQKLNK